MRQEYNRSWAVLGLLLVLVSVISHGGRRVELFERDGHAGFSSFDVPSSKDSRVDSGGRHGLEEEVEAWGAKGENEDVRVDDPPSGWIDMPTVTGHRSVHLVRSKEGDIERIDVPSDAVVRRVSDGWEIEVPTERPRDANDDSKWLPRGDTLTRSNTTPRAWTEKRLLEKFLRFEQQHEVSSQSEAPQQSTDQVSTLEHDTDDRGVADMDIQATHVGPASERADDRECADNDLDCLLERLRVGVQRHSPVVHVNVESPAPGRHVECGIACLIDKVVKATNGGGAGNSDESEAVESTPRAAYHFKVPAGATVVRESDGSFTVTMPPKDEPTQPKAEAAGRSIRPIDAAALPVVNPSTAPHAIVDVYAPYQDPYYCEDGSSDAECGTEGKQPTAHVHDYTLGWMPEDGSSPPPVPASGVVIKAGPAKPDTAQLRQKRLVAVMRDLLHVLKRARGSGEVGEQTQNTVQAEQARGVARRARADRSVEHRDEEEETRHWEAEERLQEKNRQLQAMLGREIERERRLEDEHSENEARLQRGSDYGSDESRHNGSGDRTSRDTDGLGLEQSLAGGGSRAKQEILAKWLHNAQLNDAASRRDEAVPRRIPGLQASGEVQRQSLALESVAGRHRHARHGTGKVLKSVGKWLGTYEHHDANKRLSARDDDAKMTQLSAVPGKAAPDAHKESDVHKDRESDVHKDRESDVHKDREVLAGAQQWEDQYQSDTDGLATSKSAHSARLMQLAEGGGDDFYGAEMKSLQAQWHDAKGRRNERKELAHEGDLLRMKVHSEKAKREGEMQREMQGTGFR